MSGPLSRRSFLNIAGASMVAAGAAPAILGAENKSGSRPAVIGEGDFRFECHHGWGEVPDTIRWKDTHGVTVDREGLVYIKHRGNPESPCDTVAVFDPDGKFVRSFGAEYAGGGHGIDVREEDGTEYLYLSDSLRGQVIKCDLNGEWVWKKRYPREAGVYKQLNQFHPTNVCFGPQGDLYVGDGYGSHYIHQYDKDGKWIRTWGGVGKGAGQMTTPHGQWLDDRAGREPQIVVADRANARLQYFTLDGHPVEILQGVPADQRDQEGRKETLTDSEGRSVPVTYVYGISFPADIDIQGEYMLVPDLHARIMIFDGKNRLVTNLGLDEEWTAEVLGGGKFPIRAQPDKWVDGRFVHPHDACFDKQGNIFVTEWVAAGRVSFLRRV